MIAKKNPGVDLERRRLAFLNVGFLVAGSFTLAAFTYTTGVEAEEEKLAVVADEITYLQADEDEVEQPKVVSKVVVVQQNEQQQSNDQPVGNESAVDENTTSTENTATGPLDNVGNFGPPGGPARDLVEIDVEKIDSFPDIPAMYIGGIPEMKKKISEVQEYPEIDRILGNQGTVFVTFVIEKDGSISNIKTKRGVSETLDREAERIIRSFPKWKPGENEYGVVRTRVSMPIRFVLE